MPESLLSVCGADMWNDGATKKKRCCDNKLVRWRYRRVGKGRGCSRRTFGGQKKNTGLSPGTSRYVKRKKN